MDPTLGNDNQSCQGFLPAPGFSKLGDPDALRLEAIGTQVPQPFCHAGCSTRFESAQGMASTTVTFFMMSPRLIFMTTSIPSTTWPNTVYPLSSAGCGAKVM